ncbi:MAG: hypothetical protein K8F91_14915, partial [Candidatus Obscuribacterales bacterium]|nr:hypothetical protein [Candidatus Obscuribacterales bacterium]
LDAELCFKRMSKSGEFLFRVQSGALIDKPVTEITGEKWQVSIIKHFDQARKSGAQTSFENETVNSEGESIPSLWSVQWSQEDELFICVIHDLTERKQAELRRQELLALVSHDLRSPLTASRLRLEAIFMLPDLEPQLKADLSRVNRSISDVIATTSDLLDLMRFEGAKVSLELKLSTIGDVERRLRQYLDAEAADYSLTVETRAEVYVMVEEDFLPRMIHALVKHARLARRDRPVDIAIGCDDASESIFIRVEPSEFRKQAEHCDEPESEAATRISFEVSLALCSEIAQRLHGNLKTYWSDSGRPSYQINLPRVSLR